MHSTVKLNLFFTYFGGKYRIARRYPKPTGDIIVEPFAGSAGYSIRHYRKNVLLFDVNERIVGLWQYLIQAKESDIVNLPEVFDDIRDLKIAQEEKWLIGFWCNKGSCEPRNKPSTWMKSKVRPNSQWGPAIKQRISSQLRFIRHWSCELCSFENIPMGLNRINVTWFIDPPYINHGHLYTYHKIDYPMLADFCKSRTGQTIVCEANGAHWLEFRDICISKSLEGEKGKSKVREVYWTNQDTSKIQKF